MRNLGSNALLSAAQAVMPQLVPVDANPTSSGIRKAPRGQFLQHPRGFPLSCKTLRKWWPKLPTARRDGAGLSFHSTRPLPVGADIELEIPLRRGVERFHGTVVLIRELHDGFDIGVALTSADTERAEIVERICTLEARLRAARDPSRDIELKQRRAEEWAALKPRLARIPSLQPLLYLAGEAGLSGANLR